MNSEKHSKQSAGRDNSQPNAHCNDNARDQDFGFVDMMGQEFALLQATKRRQKRAENSNVETVVDEIEPEDLPIMPEMEFKLPFIGGDSSVGVTQRKEAATAAPSSLVVAQRQQVVPLSRRKSSGTGSKRRVLTYAEMIGCYVLIEPMNIHSISIDNEASIVDSCDTVGRVQPKRRSPDLSGQRPKAKNKAVQAPGKPHPVGQSKVDKRREKKHQCDVCGKTFSRKSSLNRHNRIHTGEKSFECRVCKDKFPRLDYLKYHTRIHTGEKPYECQVCQKAFRRSSHLTDHTRGVHRADRTNFPCDICRRRFADETKLNIHVRLHLGEKPYECPECRKCFPRSRNLKRHAGSVHAVEKPYACRVREKKTVARLKDRTRRAGLHADAKPYKCKVCDKAFSLSCHLQLHIRVHTGEKPFECPVCRKRFAVKGNLKAHARFHTNARPYRCQLCENAYKTSSALVVHNRSHTGERPYKCQLCEKGFSTSTHLKLHTRIHHSEKPHKDNEQCKIVFAQSHSLKIHHRIHTGEKSYECPECKNTFSDQSGLKRHIRRIHHADNKLKREASSRNLRKRATVISYEDTSSSSDVCSTQGAEETDSDVTTD